MCENFNEPKYILYSSILFKNVIKTPDLNLKTNNLYTYYL